MINWVKAHYLFSPSSSKDISFSLSSARPCIIPTPPHPKFSSQGLFSSQSVKYLPLSCLPSGRHNKSCIPIPISLTRRYCVHFPQFHVHTHTHTHAKYFSIICRGNKIVLMSPAFSETTHRCVEDNVLHLFKSAYRYALFVRKESHRNARWGGFTVSDLSYSQRILNLDGLTLIFLGSMERKKRGVGLKSLPLVHSPQHWVYWKVTLSEIRNLWYSSLVGLCQQRSTWRSEIAINYCISHSVWWLK